MILGLLFHSTVWAQSPGPPAPVGRAAGTITAEGLRADLFVLAADSFGVRHTPSPALDRAADYLAGALAAAGLGGAPGMAGFFQTIPYSEFVPDSARSRLSVGGRRFVYGAEFKLGGLSANHGFGSASGPVVYVGHGLQIPSRGIDPYRGVDVRGKIILAHPEWPRGVPAAGWIFPTAYANTHGARGVLLLPGFAQLGEWNQVRDPSLSGLVGSAEVIEADNVGRVPVLRIGTEVLETLMRGERQSARDLFAHGLLGEPPPAFALDTAKVVEMTAAYRFERLGRDPRNVVAVLEGSDPLLRNQYVVLGAHYDADVEDGPRGADSVHNGADDNGSGTVALLEMARAMAGGPRPRRSVAFVWFAAEETGRWGSRFFVRHSPFPVDSFVACVNVDMIGRSRGPADTSGSLSGPDEVFLTAPAADTALRSRAEQVNEGYLRLRLVRRESGAPGDAASFAAVGVPVLTFGTGTHRDYHAVTDSADRIDYAKLERITRTILAIAWSLADEEGPGLRARHP